MQDDESAVSHTRLAYLPALDDAYRVGHVVVDTLVANWPQTRDHLPVK